MKKLNLRKSSNKREVILGDYPRQVSKLGFRPVVTQFESQFQLNLPLPKFLRAVVQRYFNEKHELAESSASQSNEKPSFSALGFEHLRVNVPDAHAIARWYVEFMGMEILPSDNAEVVYLADKDRNFMIEFSAIPGKRMNYTDVPVDAFHIAFEGHKAIEQIGETLLANGAVQEGEIYKNKNGDYVLNLRDPNGLSIQLLHRVSPFYAKPVKHTLRWEHVGLNVPGQMGAALWFVEFMNLVVPWSKDMEAKKNLFRNYRVPMIGDAARRMSFELYDKNTIAYTYSTMTHDESHVAFASNEPETVAQYMVYGGAKQVGGLQLAPNGDQFIDLFEPHGFPIRLIKRQQAVLRP